MKSLFNTCLHTLSRTDKIPLFTEYLRLGIVQKIKGARYFFRLTNRGEEVDGEPRVGRIVPGEEAVKGLLKSWVPDALYQLDHSHVLGQFLKIKIKLQFDFCYRPNLDN
jgi:hypothetical protein